MMPKTPQDSVSIVKRDSFKMSSESLSSQSHSSPTVRLLKAKPKVPPDQVAEAEREAKLTEMLNKINKQKSETSLGSRRSDTIRSSNDDIKSTQSLATSTLPNRSAPGPSSTILQDCGTVPGPSSRSFDSTNRPGQASSSLTVEDYRSLTPAQIPIDENWNTAKTDEFRAALQKHLKICKSLFKDHVESLDRIIKMSHSPEPNPTLRQHTSYHTVANTPNCLTIIRSLWDRYHNIDCFYQFDHDGQTPVHYMAMKHGVDGLRFLMRNFPREDFVKLLYRRNAKGETAVHILASYHADNGDAFMLAVKELGNECLKENSTEKKMTPALLAARCQKLQVMKFIAKRLPDYVEHVDIHGGTILHHAILNPHFEAFKFVAKSCTDEYFNKPASDGLTPESICEAKCERRKLEYLRKIGDSKRKNRSS